MVCRVIFFKDLFALISGLWSTWMHVGIGATSVQCPEVRRRHLILWSCDLLCGCWELTWVLSKSSSRYLQVQSYFSSPLSYDLDQISSVHKDDSLVFLLKKWLYLIFYLSFVACGSFTSFDTQRKRAPVTSDSLFHQLWEPSCSLCAVSAIQEWRETCPSALVPEIKRCIRAQSQLRP